MKEKLNRRNFLQRLSGAPVVAPAAVGLTTSGLWVPETKALSPGHYDFWIHGSTVQVEYPTAVKSITRLAIGSIIRQAEGTSNWFHFAVPTQTEFGTDDFSQATKVFLRARVDANTMIDKLHVYDGEFLESVNRFENLSIIGRPLQTYAFPGRAGHGRNAVGISVFVRWLREGEVQFVGAGVRANAWRTYEP